MSEARKFSVEIAFHFIKSLMDDETLHARYLLSQIGGLRYDKGFRESRDGYKVDISILDSEVFEEVSQIYSPNNEKLMSEIHTFHLKAS